MSVKNQIMLITYPDSMGKNLKDLKWVLEQHLEGVVGSVHILPFYPSSGDRGFAPLTYDEVSPEFGSWEDVTDIAKKHDMMYDFMINHISQRSTYFQDFLEKKEDSPYKDYFIRYSEFWGEDGPTEEEVDLIYKRKPKAPAFDVTFADGTKDRVWCTFDEEQIDLDLRKEATLEFVRGQLKGLCEHGAKVIRIDAFAYAVKKKETSCFFVEPEIWELLEMIQKVVEPYDVTILPEIHEHYSIQMNLADHGYWVYDFALPMLVLHTLYFGDRKRLVDWMKVCPRNQYTTLDTHDGIGVVDVVDLMTPEEIDRTKEALFERGANVKKKYNSSAYHNLDIYQLNCTYYSALGDQDRSYLLARAIQFFAPGVPQVYYVGLLAGENDIELLEATKVGRNINRHNYTIEEIEGEVERPVVKKLFEMMRFRNTYPAFNVDMTIIETNEPHILEILWTKESYQARLKADLKTHAFSIAYLDRVSGELKTLSY